MLILIAAGMMLGKALLSSYVYRAPPFLELLLSLDALYVQIQPLL
jgi:hypothetical protein